MSTPQAPIGSRFGAASTAQEVIAGHDLTGKVAIVTGGYAGLGLETARVMAAAGAKVIVPARNIEKARAAGENVPGLVFAYMDLMDPNSIDEFADCFLEDDKPLHFLINNAAVMANPLTRDSRGYESQFSTNHLGHFQLTARLWPALVKAEGARVVAVSSRGHVRAGVDFDDPMFESREYLPYVAYGQSKTANALFAVALDALGAREGVRAFSLHPGVSSRPISSATSRANICWRAVMWMPTATRSSTLKTTRRPLPRVRQPLSGALSAMSWMAWVASIARTAISPRPCLPTPRNCSACAPGRPIPSLPSASGS